MYIYLGILTNIQVILQSWKLCDSYKYISTYTEVYSQLSLFNI